MFFLLCGEGVVQADGAAHGKAAIGHIMRIAGRPFLDLCIDDQRANTQFFFVSRRTCWVSGDGVWDLFHGPQCDNVRLCSGKDKAR